MRLLATLAILATLLCGCTSKSRETAVYTGTVTDSSGETYTLVVEEKRQGETKTDTFGSAMQIAKPLASLAGINLPNFQSAPPPKKDDYTTEFVTAGVALATAGYGAYQARKRKREHEENIKLKVDSALRETPPET